jgi:hypothetical protein
MRLSNPFAAPPRMKPKKVKRDTDAERAEKNYVRARDNGCVAPRAAREAGIIHLMPCQGRIEVDHVRASGGLGLKSETHRRNMVSLCLWHHRAKTEWGRVWRPLLLAYLERVER